MEITGYGRITQVGHILEYTDHRDAKLYVFYDLNLERAGELTDTHTGRIYETYKELLEGEKIGAVSIYVPNESRAEMSIVALKMGRDALCGKPMTVTLEECRQAAGATEETEGCSMIGQNQKLTKGHALARKLIERGDIGKVMTFRTTFGCGGPETWSIDPGSNTWFFDKKKVAMEAMADLGIHRTDLTQYLMGEYMAETIATTTTLDRKDGSENLVGMDGNVICICKMESSVIGTMTTGWTYYGQKDNSTILYRSKGIMRIYEDPGCCIEIIEPDDKVILYSVDQIQTNDRQIKPGAIGTFMNCIIHREET